MNVGQPKIAALVAVGQPFVVEAQAMQNRRVEVVDVDRVLGDVVAEVVRLTDHTRFNAAACQQN